jgi:acyl-CoA synthetase (NDP forming)/RimJ/RimL family protein N-acetyltransferase
MRYSELVEDVFERWECDALTSDGRPVHLRPIRSDDGEALAAFHRGLSPESVYFRFFNVHPELSAKEVEWFTHVEYRNRMALVAQVDDRLVAVGRYDRCPGTATAEVAFVVADEMQGHGIATLLLEHLAAVGASHGLERFVAYVLPGNRKMLDVFRRSGFEERAQLSGDQVDVVLPLARTAAAVEAVEAREHGSEARSIARLLDPSSVAVVGASDRPGSVGGAVMRNLLGGGFAGAVHPVNPRHDRVTGVPAFPWVGAVPGPVDLAVIAVPAPEVEAVVADCAAKGVTGLVILSAGFAEDGDEGRRRQQRVLDLARRHGMRLVGPNCLGIVKTEVGLDATFAPFRATPGNVGCLSQSGALGIALLERMATLGLGVSSFVSVGNKADVSGNDLLQYGEDDPGTGVILLYLESFGNPRKFARIARRVSRRKPIVALKSGRTAAGSRAASSHTAAMASPDGAVDALFAQTGVIRVDTLTELFETATLLAWQPLPAGRRVGVVGNSGGPETMACDAAVAAGLDPAAPVDLLAGATPDQVEAAVRAQLADDRIDAVVVVLTPVLDADPEALAAAVTRAAEGATKPVVASVLAVPEAPVALREHHIPWYSSPEAAVQALARAVRYAGWRRRDPGEVPDLPHVHPPAARRLVGRGPGWLAPAEAADLLALYGIDTVATRTAATPEDAVRRADDLGYPVVVKTAEPGIVHKSDIGAVRVGLRTPDEVRRAAADIAAVVGGTCGFVVQPLVAGGVEMIAGITQDPAFGPLVMVGAGGITAELLADRALRILPLTDHDAADAIRSLRLSPLLFGYRGHPKAAVDRLEDLLLRLARLADDLPEVAELDCNPVIVTPTAAVVVDAKVRIAEPTPRPADPLRRLR